MKLYYIKETTLYFQMKIYDSTMMLDISWLLLFVQDWRPRFNKSEHQKRRKTLQRNYEYIRSF